MKKKDQEKFIAGHTAKNVYIISQPLPDRQGFMWKIKRLEVAGAIGAGKHVI